MTPEKTHPMRQHLDSLLEHAAKSGNHANGKPCIACQVTWITGAGAPGVVTATDTPGVYQLLVEGVANGQRRVFERVFLAEHVMFLDLPQDLPPAQSRSSIIMPGA